MIALRLLKPDHDNKYIDRSNTDDKSTVTDTNVDRIDMSQYNAILRNNNASAMLRNNAGGGNSGMSKDLISSYVKYGSAAAPPTIDFPITNNANYLKSSDNSSDRSHYDHTGNNNSTRLVVVSPIRSGVKSSAHYDVRPLLLTS
uniref:Uncharacterized protein n=1 Tax=Lygus hesperus TaxID=30085 RepID=A0A0A9YU62_LYGHE